MKPQERLCPAGPPPWPEVALPPLPAATGLVRLRLLAGVLPRLGLSALARYARHRLTRRTALPTDAPVPEPPFLWADAAATEGIDWFGAAAAWRDTPSLSVPTAGDFDIRLVWETGRLVDLPALAPPDAEALVRDFVRANPPFRGPHWACGQEAAIRLAHLLAAREAIGGAMLPGLRALVALHRTRIAATLDYAIAQDNNHAVSEAAGLWAASLTLGDEAGAARGKALLERAVLRLFAKSGAFSQQAMRYHVVALEMAAFAARFAGARGLSDETQERLADGVAWLARLTDPQSGRAWRVGPDDSSRFFAAPPDDLRPTLARASDAFPPVPDQASGSAAWLDAEGGFASLSAGPLKAFLRLPVHRFRPGQADALHLDLWRDGEPLLADAGSALYNLTADALAPDLARTAAHNTIAFDDDDQMPRLSRFLYGAWLRPAALQATPTSITAAYRDWKGRFHRREVRLADPGVAVTDRFDGRFERATLRWRLPPGGWRLDGAGLAGGPLRLRVQGARMLRLVRLPLALHYGAWTTTPALEATADRPGSMSTLITLP